MPTTDPVAGCRCDGVTVTAHEPPCEELRRRRRIRHKLKSLYGSAIVHGERLNTILADIRELHDGRGLTFDAIDRMVGVPHSTSAELASGKRRKLSIRNAEKYRTRLDMGAIGTGASKIDVKITQRKLQALAAHGIVARTIAARVETHSSHISDIASGKSGRVRITHSLARAIDGVYEDLLSADPTTFSSRHNLARISAAKKGYAPPECWPDKTIDDPDAEPDWTLCQSRSDGMTVDTPHGPADLVAVERALRATPGTYTLADRHIVYHRLANMKWKLRTDPAIAAALGVKPKSLQKMVDRAQQGKEES